MHVLTVLRALQAAEEAKAKREAQSKAAAELEARVAKAAADEQAEKEAEAKAKKAAEAKAKKDAEEKAAKEAAEVNAKKEADEKAATAKKEADEKAAKAKKEADEKAAKEAEANKLEPVGSQVRIFAWKLCLSPRSRLAMSLCLDTLSTAENARPHSCWNKTLQTSTQTFCVALGTVP
jgi:hypothetical protein